MATVASVASSRCSCGALPGRNCRSVYCVRNFPLTGMGEDTHPGSLVPDVVLKSIADSRPAARPAEPPTIAEGSVVRLKSGGPRMTVDEVRADGIAHTIRYVGSDETGWQTSREALSVASLELATD